MIVGVRQFLRPAEATAPSPFCPGCGNGILRGLIIRAVTELGIDLKKMLFVGGIGCSGSMLSSSYQTDVLHTLHGRAIAFATGAKLFNPELLTMVVSGDGDLADIGGNHLIHAARRNIDLKVVLSNNMCYGMTGGQVCSTTPSDSKTMTTPLGNPYRPFDLTRLVLAAGATYAARYSVAHPFALINSIKKALTTPGFCFIEVLSICPVQYGRRNEMTQPVDMLRFLLESCVTREQAAALTAEAARDRIVIGEFSDGRE